MTWWGWALLGWALLSLPAGLLVGRVLHGSDQRPGGRRPLVTTRSDIGTLGEYATPRAVRGRMIRS
jgi:hypothetical protein